MENIFSFRGKLSPEQIESLITAQNERYRRAMEEDSYMELDEHYCDEGGHYHPECMPDGRDLYDAYVERTMQPSLDEQMDSPEFKMASLALELTCTRQTIKALEKKLYDTIEAVEFQLSKRMDRIQENIDLQADALVKHIYPEPDDYDTQRQIEEELPAEFWQREY